MKTMTDDHDDTLNFGTFNINFISNTSKDDGFLNRRFRLFFFKEAEKIWTLQTNLSKVLRKKGTLQISFFKGCRQKFEGLDSNNSYGGADKKWNVPFPTTTCINHRVMHFPLTLFTFRFICYKTRYTHFVSE